MSLLIDGYNVLYAVGILGGGGGPGTLLRARSALLNFLAEALDPDEVHRTTVVFDAVDAPRDLPHSFDHRGLQVRFSVGYESADAMLAELIRTESTPRQLTVVSSDRQVQRAARRRRAKAVDSDTWWHQAQRRRRSRRRKPREASARLVRTLSEEEVAFWLDEFGDAPISGPSEAEQASRAGESPEELPDLDNPFPPGYAEDLEE